MSWITDVRLSAWRDLDDAMVRERFEEPGSAIDLLTADLVALWGVRRSGDPNERRIGTIDLDDGAYLQWIGYAERIVLECSSNAFLTEDNRLDEQQERTLLRAGFQPPDDREPNFWISVEERSQLGRAAFSLVAVLTAVFGVYAG